MYELHQYITPIILFGSQFDPTVSADDIFFNFFDPLFMNYLIEEHLSFNAEEAWYHVLLIESYTS